MSIGDGSPFPVDFVDNELYVLQQIGIGVFIANNRFHLPLKAGEFFSLLAVSEVFSGLAQEEAIRWAVYLSLSFASATFRADHRSQRRAVSFSFSGGTRSTFCHRLTSLHGMLRLIGRATGGTDINHYPNRSLKTSMNSGSRASITWITSSGLGRYPFSWRNLKKNFNVGGNVTYSCGSAINFRKR